MVSILLTPSGDEPFIWWTKDIPQMKPSFNINVGVPITGSAWGRLGANVMGSAEIELNSACTDPKSMKFGVKSRLVPTFFADGVAQVGFGISGVASAGVRGLLNLVTVGIPLDIGLGLGVKNSEVTLDFTGKIGLKLATLSGYLALYIEAIGSSAEYMLFKWNGLGPKRIELMRPLTVEVPLQGL